MLYFAESGGTPDCVCTAIGEGNSCRAEIGGFVCTRPKGHEGLHVCCGLFIHQGAAWDEEWRIEIRRPIPGP